MTVDVRLLGSLEVWAGDALVPRMGGPKQRAVLAMLALQVGRVVSVDRLVDGLWGQIPPDRAVNTVQVYVSRLRKRLPSGRDEDDSLIRSRPPGYLLDLDVDQVDVHRFERLARGGADALPGSPGRGAGMLREALALWRGRPLEEFAGLPFARAEIPRLEAHWSTALQGRIEADLALGHHAELVSGLEGLVGQYPLREEWHRLLMLSLYRAGLQAEALEAYRRIKQLLAEELGIDPGAALQRLESAILAQDPSLAWTPPVREPVQVIPTESGSVESVVCRVPMRNPHFVGREQMLDDLHRRLTSGEQTVVLQALYGLGGVGKTQLAIEYAYRFAADYQLVLWINAEQPILIGAQLAALADHLGLPTERLVSETVGRVLGELRVRSDWLLIFDNAQRPPDLIGHLPGGTGGHVLVTSRHPGWGGLGGRMEVDVLTRPETMGLLRRRLPTLDEPLADNLAAELGDLPLAAAQAAGYLESTGLPPGTYLERFRTRRNTLLAMGEVIGYQGRLDTTWSLSVDQVQQDSPAAVQLLRLVAYLGPEPIPLHWFTDHPELLDEPLRTAAAEPDQLDDLVGLIVGYSLARRQGDRLHLHRLVQSAIRYHLPPLTQRQIRHQVLALLTATHPGDPQDPQSWSGYAELAPHLLATALELGDCADGRRLCLDTARYLQVVGQLQGSGHTFLVQLVNRWCAMLGPDHPDCLQAAALQSSDAHWAYTNTSEPETSGSQDTFSRCRRLLGPDHPATVTAAAALTVTLAKLGRDIESARALGQDTLERAQRVLGPNHSTTLMAAGALTFTLARLGQDVDSARDLGQATLRRAQQALGHDHPVTVMVAGVLTFALVELGDRAAAFSLGQDTLERARRVLGAEHATTLRIGTTMTLLLVCRGDVNAARILGQEILDQVRRQYSPDHAVSLAAAGAFAFALIGVGELEPARGLGQDTLERSQRILGADHSTTLLVAAALSFALAGVGEQVLAYRLSHDTVERTHRTLRPDHPVTRFAAAALNLTTESANPDQDQQHPTQSAVAAMTTALSEVAPPSSRPLPPNDVGGLATLRRNPDTPGEK